MYSTGWLSTAAGLRAAEKHPELVVHLIQALPAEQLPALSAAGAGGRTLAHAAAAGQTAVSVELLHKLSAACVDMTVQNAAGQTVLELATANAEPAVVEWAREYGRFFQVFEMLAGDDGQRHTANHPPSPHGAP